MNEIDRAIFESVTELTTEIADYKKRLHATVYQRARLGQKILMDIIMTYHSDPDKQRGSSNLDELEKGIADQKSKLNADLIPLFEQIGDQKRLKFAIDFVEILDHLQLVIDSKPR